MTALTGATINSATFRQHNSAADASPVSGQLSIWWMKEDWNDSAYYNRPKVGGTWANAGGQQRHAALGTIAATADTPVAWLPNLTVTSGVTRFLSTPDSNFGFMVDCTTGTAVHYRVGTHNWGTPFYMVVNYTRLDTVSRSIGTRAQYNTGSMAVSNSADTLTLTGGTFAANWGIGDRVVLDTASTPDTVFVKAQLTTTKLKLQRRTRKAGSGINYKIIRAYSTLFGWEAGMQGDITAAGRNEVCQAVCYGDGLRDSVLTDVNGWTTDATHYIRIYTPASERHAGVWDNNKYRREFTTTADNQISLTVTEEYVKYRGPAIFLQREQ
jgi:hypothetical protein